MAGKFKLLLFLCLVTCPHSASATPDQNDTSTPPEPTDSPTPDQTGSTPPEPTDSSATKEPTSSTSISPSIPTTITPSTSTTITPSIPPTITPSTSTTITPSIPTTITPSTSTTITPSIPTTITPSTSTTITPSIPTVTTQPSISNETTPSNSNTTTPSNVSTATTAPPATSAPDPCKPNPCGPSSTCDPRAYPAFVCQCLAGDNYNYETKSCVSAKIFPVDLQVQNIEYVAGMENPSSIAFKNAAQTIITELTPSFSGTSGFFNITVVQIRKIEIPKFRAQNGINATVDIIYQTNSKITTEEVITNLEKAICEKCPLQGTFTNKNLCDNAISPCDTSTTTCDNKDGAFSCHCKEGLYMSNLTNRICIACPIGQTYNEDKKECKNCPFGYSGLLCEDYLQLALVIVACVLGAFLIICLIVLLVCLRFKKSSKKKAKNVDLGKPYVSHSAAKSPLVYSNSSLDNREQPSVNGLVYGDGGKVEIPRATATSVWNSKANNLEMSPRDSRQNMAPMDRQSNLYFDQDDMNPHSHSRPQGDLSSFARPRNPYVQSRPPVNPYNQSQGYSNPAFVQDKGRFY